MNGDTRRLLLVSRKEKRNMVVSQAFLMGKSAHLKKREKMPQDKQFRADNSSQLGYSASSSEGDAMIVVIGAPIAREEYFIHKIEAGRFNNVTETAIPAICIHR